MTSESAAGAGGEGQRVAVPRLVRYSGVLRDPAVRPTHGVEDLTFSLYALEAGGEALWFETQTVEVDAQGRYTVLLGAMHPDGLPMDLFTSGEARWLGVSVGKLPEQARVLLVSVPYALKAGDSESLGGKPASAYALQGQAGTSVLAVGGTQNSEPANGAALTSTSGTQPTSLVTAGQTHFIDTTSDYVVRVTQNGTGRGLYGLSQTGEAVWGQILGASGTTYGVRGLTPSTTGAGVFGQSTATTGPAYGVRGNSASVSGAGLAGFNTATSGSAFGIIGQTTSNQGVALFGRALSASGPTYGLQGIADSTSGTGINAQATALTGTTIGLLAKVYSSTGTALIVDNAGGGQILSARNNNAERISVVADGSLVSSGSLTGTRLISTVATGTAPLTVSSTTMVTGLNADLLDGFHATTFATLGANAFVGDQSITGNLTLSGSINSGLFVRANATSPSIIEGFSGNTITSGVLGGTISGGGVTANTNKVTDDYGTIGGGYGNQAGNNAGTTSDQTYSTVAGGLANQALATGSAIGGGGGNTTSGQFATVPGGNGNAATGLLSFAAGNRARALHDGAFVWSDNSTVTTTDSTAVNQFIVRAAGGVWFGTAGPVSFPASSFLATSTGAYLSTGGAWTNGSDRNSKEQFSPVDGQALLARLAAIPVSTWNYKSQDTSIRHMGPMAQDFRAAFGLGEDDKHIATVDADGVSLAAIQALYELSKEKDQKIEQLKQQVNELQGVRRQMAILQARLARLEKQSGTEGASQAARGTRVKDSRSGVTTVKVKF